MGANRTRAELHQLGIDTNNTSKLINQVLEVSKEVENAQLAAGDLLRLHYEEKLKHLEKDIKQNKERLSKKQYQWSKPQLSDLKDTMELQQERAQEIINLLQQRTPYDTERYQQMRKRKADSLITDQKLKKRKWGQQGRPELIDEEVEEFMLKAIEGKATYHGRRKERRCL